MSIVAQGFPPRSRLNQYQYQKETRVSPSGSSFFESKMHLKKNNKLKLYLLLRHAQFGSIENHTKVNLNFELFSNRKCRRLWNYSFNEEIGWYHLHYCKALNFNQSVHFCLALLKSYNFSFSMLQGRVNNPGFSNSPRQFIFLYLHPASMPLMQHNSFSKHKFSPLSLKMDTFKNVTQRIFTCSFDDQVKISS